MSEDEKKMVEKPNKALYPAENKQDLDTAANTPTRSPVRIKMRQGRAAEGVTVDANGYATVSAETAERLIAIQYATLAEEK